MGIRRGVCRAGGTRHRQPRDRAGSHPVRHGRVLRLWPQRADPGPGPRRQAGIGLPRHEDPSGPANGSRAANPLCLRENLERAGELRATLREVADAHAATPAQIALAWVIHPPAVAAIPGASSVEQVERNAAAADITLTEDQYQALLAASARFRPISGPAALLRLARARFGS